MRKPTPRILTDPLFEVVIKRGDITVTGTAPLPGTLALLAIGFAGVGISGKKESMES